MKIREERVFRIPIDEIRDVLKMQYKVDLSGIDPYIEKDSLVFSIRPEEGNSDSHELTTQPIHAMRETVKSSKKRRQRRKRNRIRVRGWNVVAKITNSKGLVANIYEPLVTALEGKQIAKKEQRKIIRQVIIENGNDPSEESIDYFLENTLEYLEKKNSGGMEKNE